MVVCPGFRGPVASTELRTRSRNLCLTSWHPYDGLNHAGTPALFGCGGLAGERPHHPSTRQHGGLRDIRPPARPRARELGQHPGRAACLQPAPLQDEEVWPVTRAWLRDGTELSVRTPGGTAPAGT